VSAPDAIGLVLVLALVVLVFWIVFGWLLEVWSWRNER
jgi:hypothetical protein